MSAAAAAAAAAAAVLAHSVLTSVFYMFCSLCGVKYQFLAKGPIYREICICNYTYVYP